MEALKDDEPQAGEMEASKDDEPEASEMEAPKDDETEDSEIKALKDNEPKISQNTSEMEAPKDYEPQVIHNVTVMEDQDPMFSQNSIEKEGSLKSSQNRNEKKDSNEDPSLKSSQNSNETEGSNARHSAAYSQTILTNQKKMNEKAGTASQLGAELGKSAKPREICNKCTIINKLLRQNAILAGNHFKIINKLIDKKVPTAKNPSTFLSAEKTLDQPPTNEHIIESAKIGDNLQEDSELDDEVNLKADLPQESDGEILDANGLAETGVEADVSQKSDGETLDSNGLTETSTPETLSRTKRSSPISASLTTSYSHKPFSVATFLLLEDRTRTPN